MIRRPPRKRIWRLYGYHKNNAKRRRIAFQISFEAWVGWWKQQLGPRWWSKRGKRAHQYVMARYDDKGPYRLDNVHCITFAQNARDSRMKQQRAKLRIRMLGNTLGCNAREQALTPEQHSRPT
jgi:hypothetical protein